MNKITLLMLKVITARSLIMVFMCVGFFSYKTLKNDKKLLTVIIDQGNYTQKDSVFFNKKGANNSIINFFRYRNTKNSTMNYYFKERHNQKINYNDSIYREIDSVAYVEQPTLRNNYITLGKGTSLETEEFLKDSFDYKKIQIKKWNSNKKTKSYFVKKKTKHTLNLTISKPVYNLSKNKAIIYTSIRKKSSLEETIYFLIKKEEKWTIIYKENTHYFLTLKGEFIN